MLIKLALSILPAPYCASVYFIMLYNKSGFDSHDSLDPLVSEDNLSQQVKPLFLPTVQDIGALHTRNDVNFVIKNLFIYLLTYFL